MVTGVAYQFTAFISYSHEDEKWAARLQSKLEGYHVDRALHGVPTPVGAVPSTLGRIFRDRQDLAAGASLSAKLRGALDNCQFLIVVCSPAAAASAYVNEEIRYFRRQGHGERILTFIVNGEPGHPDANCFPPALLQRIGTTEGEGPGRAPEEPLAADARVGRDGFEFALLKIVAGLLGLPLDVIVQRSQERQAKERFWWHAAVATLALVATVAAGSAYHTWRTSQRATALIDNSIQSTTKLAQTTGRVRDDMGVSAVAAIELLKSIEDLFNQFQSYDPRNPKVRLQRAEMLLEFARNYGKLKRTTEQERLAQLAFVQIEGIAGSPDLEEAVEV